MNDKASLSSFLNGTVEELRENKNVALLYLLIVIPFGTLSAYFDPSDAGDIFNVGLMIDQSLLSQGAFAVVAVVAAFVVGLVAYYWLIAGMTLRTTSPGFVRVMPFIGILILSYIGIGFGMVLFLIPGIFLAVRWVAVLPLVVTREDRAMDTFGDSNQMTQGYGWTIFGTGLILAIAVWILALLTAGVAYLASGAGLIVTAFVSSIIDQLSAVLFAGFTVTAYRQLSDNDEELAEVFE